MGFILDIFDVAFYQPIFNMLVVLYKYIPGSDIGVAIIALTLIIRGLLYIPSRSALRAQRDMQALQPKIAELKEKYKDDREGQAKAMMEVYREHKVNPAGSCLPLLLQMPFLFAIYRVLRDGLEQTGADFTAHLYSGGIFDTLVGGVDSLNAVAFGFLDLSEASIYLAVLAGAFQFIQGRMLPHMRPQVKSKGAQDEEMAAALTKNMMYVMPVVTVVIGASLPSGLALYWMVSTIFSIVQQWWIFRGIKKDDNSNDSDVVEGEATEKNTQEKLTAKN